MNRDNLERGLSQEILDALRYEVEPENETLAQYETRVKHLNGRLRRYKGLIAARHPEPQNRQAATITAPPLPTRRPSPQAQVPEL